MYFYKVMYKYDSVPHEFCTAFSSSLPATKEEIISSVEENGGVGGAMIRAHFNALQPTSVWTERISAAAYFADIFLDWWDDFSHDWLSLENFKNKLICYLMKHTHCHATVFYTCCEQYYVNSVENMATDYVKWARENGK
jgi:hypothetical protein